LVLIVFNTQRKDRQLWDVLVLADRRTGRHYEVKSHFSQFCESAKNCNL